MNKGWMRLGIVLTVVWLLLVGGCVVLEREAPLHQSRIFFSFYRVLGQFGWQEDDSFDESKFLILLTSPIIVLWTLILVVPAIKWVRDGFRSRQ